MKTEVLIHLRELSVSGDRVFDTFEGSDIIRGDCNDFKSQRFTSVRDSKIQRFQDSK